MSHCKKKANEQPCFILLAQDNFAIELVENWIKRAEILGASKPKIDEAKATRAKMIAWRQANPSKCKYPD